MFVRVLLCRSISVIVCCIYICETKLVVKSNIVRVAVLLYNWTNPTRKGPTLHRHVNVKTKLWFLQNVIFYLHLEEPP